MSDTTQNTIDHEPWNTWGLTPYVPDNRSTETQITELMSDLPKGDSLSDAIGIRSCAFKRRGAYNKMSQCDRRAAIGSAYCNVHRRHLFD